MPVIGDKFGKASISTDYAVATTVKTTRVIGATVLEAFDLSKFAPDTPVFFVTYKKTTDPVTGVVSITNLVSWKGLVNTGANTLTNLTVAPGYADAGNAVGDFIECIPTSFWENSLIEGIFVGHNPDGTFKTSAINDTINTILSTNLNPALTNQSLYANAIINGGAEVAQRAIPNLSTTYQYGAVDRFAAKATGTAVTSGTISRLVTGMLAATKGYDIQLTNVTITGTGVGFLRYRMEAKDALNFVNQAASFGVRVYHNAGGSVNYTVYIRKANAADNFTAVTDIANSGAISVPNATPTWLKFENINTGSLGDVSNGIEIEIQFACGAVSGKNFNFAEFTFNRGDKAIAYVPKPYQVELAACTRYYLDVNPSGVVYMPLGYVFVGGGNCWGGIPTPSPMRATPTISSTDITTRYAGTDTTWSSISVSAVNTHEIAITGVTPGTSNGNSGVLTSSTGVLRLDAEL